MRTQVQYFRHASEWKTSLRLVITTEGTESKHYHGHEMNWRAWDG